MFKLLTKHCKSARFTSLRSLTALFSLVISLLLLIPQAEAQVTKRIYLVGNSVTDAINYYGLKAIAESKGNTHIWARHMIPGAPLSVLWNSPSNGFIEEPYGYPNNAFVNYEWDAISLQPFDRMLDGDDGDVTMSGNYVNLAKGKSPNVQFYIYMRWVRTPDSKDPSDASLTADTWTNLWNLTYTGGWDGTNESKDYFEKLMLACRNNFTSVKPFLIVPVGEVFSQLNTKMKNGQVPGYSKIWQVYSDGIHMKGIGAYIAALTYYSTLYKADPRGTAVPSEYGTIPLDVVSIIQQTTWDVVSTYQYSGVNSSSVAVTSVGLNTGSLNLANGTTSQLTATVNPSNATNKSVTWSTSNSLVATVSSTGLVTATGVGNATITVTTADGGKTASCSVSVTAGGGSSGVTINFEAATVGALSSNTYTESGFTFEDIPGTENLYIRSTNDGYASKCLTNSNFNRGIRLRKSDNAAFNLTSFKYAGDCWGGLADATVTAYFSGGTTSSITITSSVKTYTTATVNWSNLTKVEIAYNGGTTANFGALDEFVIGSGVDATAPSKATALSASVVKDKTFTLSWTNATDNVGVTGYDVFRGTTKVNSAIITTNSYAVAGLTACTSYSFTVKAYDAAGNSSTSDALSVKTNCAPTAVMGATPVSGTAPLAVAFSASGSSDPDAGDYILGYEWDFGDGSAKDNSNAPSHTYNTAGTYTASLKVMDNRDFYSAAVTKTITVTASGSTLRTPENPASTVAGLDYAIYNGSWDLLPNFGALTAAATGNIANFDISSKAGTDNFGFRFTGFISIATDGDYTFYTSSDDGSKLYIGTTQVVDNDGLHATQERSGTIGLKTGKHAITVTVFEKTGGESLTVSYAGPSVTKQTIPASVLFRANNIVTGDIVMEYWETISGTAVSAIPVTTSPAGTQILTSLEGPTNWKDNYGVRIRGYVVPSQTGSYTFRVAGDDNTELWLSTSDNAANKSRIAYHNGWTNTREWAKYTEQTSAAISLTANTKYYVEVLMKEGGGGDNVAVGWTGPGISTITVIPGANLARYEGGSTGGDTQKPATPSGLTSTSVTSSSVALTWTGSTDNVGVTGYDVYRGTSLAGTATGTSFTVSGLAASTPYSFTVRAKDAAGNQSDASNTYTVTTASTGGTGTPQLPIGMNITGLTYYSTCLIFTDAMTSSGDMFTFYEGGPWNSEKISEIPRDANGWPTSLPRTTTDGKSTMVRFLINSFYSGRHVLTFEGAGTITISGVTNTKVSSNKYYIDFNGSGGNAWIDINQTTSGNNIRNMKILPIAYENSSNYPTFNAKFLDGLRPFHALRFMDWIGTNNSEQKYWADRSTKTYYSQATSRGICYDYAIDLCNELKMDAWVTIPHQADDNFITQAARLWRDNLNAINKVYIEYSNEIWNWQFTQAGYCVNNAPGHPNAYVSADLAAISATGNHPEKDAYMMARVFRLWKAEFTGTHASRLTRVAGVQHGWMDNTRRVLDYLFDVDKAGCDVVSPGGYFGLNEEDHNRWLTQCATITPSIILDDVAKTYVKDEAVWTDETAEYVNQRGVGYVVYEGGQHMQPYLQGEYCYNQQIFDAQIHPKMYDMYMTNFRKHTEPKVNCQLFMAFSYVGKRESKYGSWGHLESLDQIGSVSNYMTIAPKYQALLDANTPRTKRTELDNASETITESTDLKGNSGVLMVYPNPAREVLHVVGANIERMEVLNTVGESVKTINQSYENSTISLHGLTPGLYILKVYRTNSATLTHRFIKQ